MAQPLVSIIIATYNRADLLPRALESVMLQSWQYWELCIIDDGSTDDTPKLLKEFGTGDGRIRVFRQENAGPSASRNLGLQHCFGDYIAFLDSDDAYAVDHIALRVREMRMHPETDMLYGGFRAIGNDTQLMVPDMYNPGREVPIENCIVGGTFFVRHGVIEKAGGWQDGYAEDAQLFQRIRAQFRVRHVSYPTYLYHRDSIDSRCSQLR
ncbi:glycosyltransferase [bacterium]|nr:glycosyltransferase [bacterium]